MRRGTITFGSPLQDEVGQGLSDSGRSLAPSDPWTSGWVPPDAGSLAHKHALAQKRERLLARKGHSNIPVDLDVLEAIPEPSLAPAPNRPATGPSRLAMSMATLATAYWYYVLATIGLALLVPLAIGWSATTVATGSMEPLVSPGDVVAFADYGGEALHPGSIIRFDDPVRSGQTVTHRIASVNPDGTYQTKGDANAEPDSVPVPKESITGVARFVTPHAGLPQLWAITENWTVLAIWMSITVGAGMTMSLYGRPPTTHVRRKFVFRPALAAGLMAALGGVGTAAWSSAAFAANDGNASSFESAADFPNFTPGGSVGTTTCAVGTTTWLALAEPIAAGNTIIIRYTMRSRQANAPLGATDTQGNSYSVDAHAVNGTTAESAVISSYLTAPLAAGDQVTVTHPEGQAVSIQLDTFSGVAATGRVATSGTATGHSQTPSVTIAVPDDNTLVIGVVAASHANAMLIQPAGWTALDGGTANCGQKFLYGAGWIDSGPAGDVSYDPALDKNARFAEVVVSYRRD